jgi:hypothetical protein
MSLPLDLLQAMQGSDSSSAWKSLFSYAWDICGAPIKPGKAKTEIAYRERSLADIDYALATTCWSLWQDYEKSVDQTAPELKQWWGNNSSGKAVLILDALSLRELPWLLAGAKEHGYTIHEAKVTGAELPADTTPFAKALGFPQRSALESGNGSSKYLPGAVTESVELPWKDCINLVGSQPDIFFWHHWPDSRLHDLDDPGKGVEALSQEAEAGLSGDDFWAFVEKLSQGRKMIITGDHGYAASGLFPDVGNADQAAYLKKRFKSRRWMPGVDEQSWLPPMSIGLDSAHGQHELVLGRRKWKSHGGYPTLTHGGLSLLEVAVPFIELSREN